jgi:RNA polymerase sigma-70 factor (ECF subfamily)
MRKAIEKSEIALKLSPGDPIRTLASPASRVVPSRASRPQLSEIGELLTRLRPQLEAAALRVTHEREAARDAVQQAALKAIRFRHQFRGKAALSTWIHRIVVNEALMWRRGEGRRALTLEKLEREMPERGVRAAPDELLSQRRRVAAVARGLELLGAGDREVLLELASNAHSLRELTARLGIPRTALRTRIFRARRRLEKLMETA